MDRKQHRALALCRRSPRGDVLELKRRALPDGQRAHFAKLVYCGKPICPLCGPKIAAERAADIAAALTEHYARGGQVALVTLTLRHTRAQRLTELLDGLSSAWASIRQNKTPRRLLREHTDGWIKRLEVTLGPNGWHPHLHVLLFLGGHVDADVAGEISAAMYTAWSGRLVRRGLGEPSREHGIDVKLLDLAAAHEKVADYVAKSAALELASAGTKIARRAENRTPLQLLADVGEVGLADDLARWYEYVEAMHGRHHIEWSQGLRARLIAELPELTDEEAAAADDALGRLLGLIDRDTWQRITQWPPGPAQVLEWAEAVEDDDAAAELVDAQLAAHGLGRLLQPQAGSTPAQPSG